MLGGFTVLTHLNPWLVAAHLLLSMAIIATTFVLWWRVRDAVTAPLPDSPAVRALVWTTVAVTAAVLVIGTVVTGSGPHAGDRAEDGTVRRTGLQVSSMAQLHADVVMVLIGLTVGLVALLFAVHAAPTARRAAVVLIAVELGQGVDRLRAVLPARPAAAGRAAHVRRVPGLARRAEHRGPAPVAGAG